MVARWCETARSFSCGTSPEDERSFRVRAQLSRCPGCKRRMGMEGQLRPVGRVAEADEFTTAELGRNDFRPDSAGAAAGLLEVFRADRDDRRVAWFHVLAHSSRHLGGTGHRHRGEIAFTGYHASLEAIPKSHELGDAQVLGP